MHKRHYLYLLGLIGVSVAQAQTVIKPTISSKTSFAIVVDATTYAKAEKEILDYKQAVEKSGLGTYVIYADWTSPDAIKKQLQTLYTQKKQPLEGTVLIGDIPIVMVRDAQYLTSAFKMNQKIRWERSSVPSDRFYDDFDLNFTFLKQDTAASRSNLYYYTLAAESPQYIQMDIYSARIKPSVAAGEDATVKIQEYLRKVVASKSEVNPLNSMIASTGHGYNSNAISSVIGDAVALRTQFPSLYKVGNSYKTLNFRQTNTLKFNLLRELKRPGLDFALMTGHGTDDLQLLNGYPETSSPQVSMVNVARYLRGKLRDAKDSGRDLQTVKDNFKNSLGVSDKWMDDAFEIARIEEDSIFNHNMDIHMSDIKDAGIKAKFVYLNSCLTGSYQLPEYIAGYYPFSNNETIVALANSVGVLQDLWPTELMGTLQHGVSAGNWMKHIAYLETHLFGDPTFTFASENSWKVNEHISLASKDKAYWEKLLQQGDADLQALALVYLSRSLPEAEVSPLLKKTYFESANETTRTQAFNLLKQYENDDYFAVLHAAKFDSYEFIRRAATDAFNEFGGADYVKDLIELYIADPHANRIAYRVNWNLAFVDPAVAKKEIEAQIRNNKLIDNSDKVADDLLRIVAINERRAASMVTIITDKKAEEKERLSEINTLRLYRFHILVPTVIKEILDNENSDLVRITGLEALSWFPLSYQRQLIYDTCDSILKTEGISEEVKYQALKTKNVMAGHSKK